jgi:hypothetical protein
MQNTPTAAVASMPASRKVQTVVDFIQRTFDLHVTPRNTYLLIDCRLHEARLLEVEAVAGMVMRAVLEHLRVEVSKKTIQSAITILRTYPGRHISVSYGRSVRSEDGSLYIQDGQRMLVYPRGQEGYRNVEERGADIAFFWPKNAQPLPYAVLHGGSANPEPLRRFLQRCNVPKGQDILVMAWMMTVMLPEASRVLMELTGMPKNGKTSLQAVLKYLLDTSAWPLQKKTPKKVSDVHQLAQDDFLISLDQVKTLNEDVQSELANIMDGQLIEWTIKRQEHDSQLLVRCPVILNGLQSVVTEPELAERSVSVELPSLSDANPAFIDQLQASSDMANAYQSLRDLLVYVAHDGEAFPLDRQVAPAMQDFCRFGCRVAEAFDGSSETFWQAYDDMQQQRRAWELEENPVAGALHAYMAQREEDRIEKTARAWLEELEDFRPKLRAMSQWPANSRKMGHQLSSIVDLMCNHGVLVERVGKRGGYCYYRVTRKPQETPVSDGMATGGNSPKGGPVSFGDHVECLI